MDSKEFHAARERLKMTWHELAAALQIGVRSVSRYEHGERRIPEPVAMAMRLLEIEPKARRKK